MPVDLIHNIENSLVKKRDQALILECLNGNAASFTKLVSLYQKRVEAVGMSFFHNVYDTEDFVQDVFLKAYTKLNTFRGDCQFSTWLTRIAYTTAINSKNRRKEYDSIADEEIIQDNSGTPEDREIRRITCIAIKEAVKELPEKYAICLDLYFFHDLSYDEISVITDFPVNTIKSHIFRAKQILREKLKDYCS